VIRKILMSTVAIVAISGTAFAADLPSRRAPPVYIPPPIPVFSWTGFYIGGQVGYAFGKTTVTEDPFGPTFQVGRANGIIGGGHVGYNFSTQSLPVFGSALGGFTGAGGVIGIEGDVDGSDYRSSIALGALGETFRSQIGGSIRGRLGIAVDRALFYATGGAAFAEFQDTFTGPTGYDSLSHTRVGYTVGGGVEYAITTQWSLRAEYRYSDYGTYNSLASTAFPTGAVNNREKITMQRAQVGFSYKFDTPALAPVVARY
jgi:outer membrane immunogenic protein